MSMMRSDLLPIFARARNWKAEWAALKPQGRCLGILRGIGVLVLLGIPLFLLLHPASGPEVEWPGARFVWTLLIALLPLLIVGAGFYTWRQICPLAFFARMSEWLGWPDPPGIRDAARRRRRVPKW